VTPPSPRRPPTRWNTAPGPGYVTATEAAAQLGVTRQQVANLVDGGVLRGKRVDGASRTGARSRVWVEQASIDARLGGSGRAQAAPDLDRPVSRSTPDARSEDVSRDRDRWRTETIRQREANQQLQMAFEDIVEANRLLNSALGYQRNALAQFFTPGDTDEN
jgi:hypothetical protein